MNYLIFYNQANIRWEICHGFDELFIYRLVENIDRHFLKLETVKERYLKGFPSDDETLFLNKLLSTRGWRRMLKLPGLRSDLNGQFGCIQFYSTYIWNRDSWYFHAGWPRKKYTILRSRSLLISVVWVDTQSSSWFFLFCHPFYCIVKFRLNKKY